MFVRASPVSARLKYALLSMELMVAIWRKPKMYICIRLALQCYKACQCGDFCRNT